MSDEIVEFIEPTNNISEFISSNIKIIIIIGISMLGIFLYLTYQYYYNKNVTNEDIADEKVSMVPDNTHQSKKIIINDNFIETDGFAGYKKGYVFKKDTQGIGYYKDIHN